MGGVDLTGIYMHWAFKKAFVQFLLNAINMNFKKGILKYFTLGTI